MKKLIWVMTVALTVCAFTVWSYAAVSISSGRHIYIPILYILTWGGLVYLGVRSKTRTPLIASLVYWIMVIAVSATALIASSGIAETFLYKYLTAPAAFAFMPFFGFIDSGSENINAFCVAVIIISAVFVAVCIFFTARLFRVRSRVILMSMSPFVLTLAGSLCLFDPFAEAFIGYLNGRAQVGAENTMLILSVIYVLGWASILVLAAYRSASRLALGSFVFWSASFVSSIWFAASYRSAVIISSLTLSPLYGFCPKNGFPVSYAGVCAAISAVLLLSSFFIFRRSSAKRIGYITRR